MVLRKEGRLQNNWKRMRFKIMIKNKTKTKLTRIVLL